MASIINWSAEQDAKISSMRADRFSWDAIAKAFGVPHRQQIIDRSKALNVPSPVRQDLADDNSDRAPLSAGSAETWGAINAGLSIEGAAYPPYRAPIGRAKPPVAARAAA